MTFPAAIEEALKRYDSEKKPGEDDRSIARLRRLSKEDQRNLFKLCESFISFQPPSTDAAYQVFQTILTQFEIENPIAVNDALYVLSLNGLLGREKNFNQVIEHENPLGLAHALHEKHSKGGIEQADFDSIIKEANIWEIAESLKTLKNTEFNTDTYKEVIEKHNNPAALFDMMRLLDKQELLKKDTFEVLKGHNDPILLFDALQDMLSEKNLAGEHISIINDAKCRDPRKVGRALSKLKREKILNGTVSNRHYNS